MSPLVERQVGLTERLGLLRRLLSSVTTTVTSERESSAYGAPGPARNFASVRERVRTDVSEILEGAGRPLHINEIHAEFIKRGLEVPGAGKPNNITVHLSEAPAIRSTARGYYELAGTTDSHTDMRYPVVDESRSKRTHV